MKKVGIGCLVALVVVGLLVVVGSRIAINRVKGFVGEVQQLTEISQLDAQVQNRQSYQPAADQPLTETQVMRYVGIQRAMLARLGERVKGLDAKYQQVSAQRGDRDLTFREMMEVWRDMVDLIVEAKRAQVEALNAAGMSLAEYNWVRAQVLISLGHGFGAFDISSLASGEPFAEPAGIPPVAVRQKNLELLKPHLDTAEDWLPLSFFGL